MPEGSELKTSRDGLQFLVGSRLLDLRTEPTGRYASDPPSGLDKILESVRASPQSIEAIEVKGKFMWWDLTSGLYMFCSYGMTGGWSLQQGKHAAFSVVTDHPKHSRVFFNDTRRFGTLKFVEGKEHLQKKLGSLGWDPLSETVNWGQLKELLEKGKHTDTTVAEALLDQGVFAGVGNYVRSESLHRAGISPHRTVGSLRESDLMHLAHQVRAVMQESYALGGTTLKDWIDPSGTKGRFSEKLRVYGKKTDPHGNPVIKEPASDGRTIHWSPAVQK